MQSAEKNSYRMSRIRSKNTQPEVTFRKMLFASGVRYRINVDMEGTPDIVIPSRKLAIFIDGCFWHKCPTCYRPPHSNRDYWDRKIQGNVKRDRQVNRLLKSSGWKVIRLWEHRIGKSPCSTLKMVLKQIHRRDKLSRHGQRRNETNQATFDIIKQS